ncbi:hypothetical protein GJ744_006211 [Endocarpon pusillum]|uniref:Uncharacterized protein n=1 Tax=Endocarpon pusillum TaxID=364733 RepID=A0A8H7ALY1_9EURO|nr:hypothetical protein GJ744_006211 [Endocarpon pusillum]
MQSTTTNRKLNSQHPAPLPFCFVHMQALPLVIVVESLRWHVDMRFTLVMLVTLVTLVTLSCMSAFLLSFTGVLIHTRPCTWREVALNQISERHVMKTIMKKDLADPELSLVDQKRVSQHRPRLIEESLLEQSRYQQSGRHR